MTSATGSGAHRRRDRALGGIGQVAGVTGIVISIILIVGALLGRGWAIGTVDTIATRLDAGIGRAITPISRASGLVGEVADRVGLVAQKAEEAAANPGPEAQVLRDLQARLQGAADRYLELRSAYTDVRAQAVSVIDRLETLDRILPGVSIPTGPIDKLTELDARIQEMDAAIVDLIGDGGPGASDRLASEIGEKARAAEAKIAGLSGRLDAIATDLQTLQGDLVTIAGRAQTAITLGTIGAILLFLYFVLLHLILFRVSRRLWLTSASGPTTDSKSVAARSVAYPVPAPAPARPAAPTAPASAAAPAPAPAKDDDATQPVETPEAPDQT